MTSALNWAFLSSIYSEKFKIIVLLHYMSYYVLWGTSGHDRVSYDVAICTLDYIQMLLEWLDPPLELSLAQ